MRRQDLAVAILDRINEQGINVNNLDIEDVMVLINAILREITISIAEGRSISIRGFGTFKPKLYKGNTKANIYQSIAQGEDKKRELYFARPTFKAGQILKTQIK